MKKNILLIIFLLLIIKVFSDVENIYFGNISVPLDEKINFINENISISYISDLHCYKITKSIKFTSSKVIENFKGFILLEGIFNKKTYQLEKPLIFIRLNNKTIEFKYDESFNQMHFMKIEFKMDLKKQNILEISYNQPCKKANVYEMPDYSVVIENEIKNYDNEIKKLVLEINALQDIVWISIPYKNIISKPMYENHGILFDNYSIKGKAEVDEIKCRIIMKKGSKIIFKQKNIKLNKNIEIGHTLL